MRKSTADEADTRNPDLRDPIRLVFVYPHAGEKPDAVGSAVLQLVEYLNSCGGFDAQVLTRKSLTIFGRTVEAGSAKSGRAFDQFRFLIRAVVKILANRNRTDVLVTLDVPTGSGYLGAIPRILNPRVLHISWVLDLYRMVDSGDQSLIDRARLAVEKRSLTMSDRIVTIGDCMEDALIGLGLSNISVIPIWQNELNLYPLDTDEVGVALPDEPTDFVYSGTARSGVHPLADISEFFREHGEGLSARMVVRGWGSEVKVVEEAVVSVSRSVMFREPVDGNDVRMALATDDVCLVSLSTSALGTCVPSKVYASMAVGRPILFVGPRRCQAAEDIVAADCGLVVEPGKVDLLREAVERLSVSEEVRSKLGRNGLAFFREKRSLSVVGSVWAEYLRENFYER